MSTFISFIRYIIDTFKGMYQTKKAIKFEKKKYRGDISNFY